jgi:WD40 repeat protein
MRSSRLVFGFVALLQGVAAIPVAAQGTDIWVASLKVTAGHVALGMPRNVTDRPGYDNQPSWSPRGDLIYFSSLRGDGQNDIWSVDVTTGKQTRITTSAPESEYSPTVMPTGTSLSVVRVERDSAQRLWRVPLNGAPPVVLITDIKPVGYHAWADSSTLALYVLGDRALATPSTLEIANVAGGTPLFPAHDIGRGLAKIPGAHAISFVQHSPPKDSTSTWTIMRYDIDSKKITRLAETLPGVEDYAWTPAGRLLCAKDSQIYEWTVHEWVPVANFVGQGITGITRLAVSPDGNDLAFVARDKSP